MSRESITKLGKKGSSQNVWLWLWQMQLKTWDTWETQGFWGHCIVLNVPAWTEITKKKKKKKDKRMYRQAGWELLFTGYLFPRRPQGSQTGSHIPGGLMQGGRCKFKAGLSYPLRPCLKNKNRGWRVQGAAVKSIHCSHRGPSSVPSTHTATHSHFKPCF